ncbi:uncharacterized protein LOC135377171 [Ornithodoros turicata]|uniref:uncharacterized protein LOC135377171 n=1 Tax=Ornithodoros turicata TaxID=34597 RepID=UPI003138999C
MQERMKVIIFVLFAIVVSASAGNVGYGRQFATGSRFAVDAPVKKPLVTVGFVREPVVKQHFVTKAVVKYVRVPVTTVTHVVRPFVYNHGAKKGSRLRFGPAEEFGSGRLGVTYIKDTIPDYGDLKGLGVGYGPGGFGGGYLSGFGIADRFDPPRVYSDLKELPVTDGVQDGYEDVLGSSSRFGNDLKGFSPVAGLESATRDYKLKGGFDDSYGYSKGYY